MRFKLKQKIIWEDYTDKDHLINLKRDWIMATNNEAKIIIYKRNDIIIIYSYNRYRIEKIYKIKLFQYDYEDLDKIVEKSIILNFASEVYNRIKYHFGKEL